MAMKLTQKISKLRNVPKVSVLGNIMKFFGFLNLRETLDMGRKIKREKNTS